MTAPLLGIALAVGMSPRPNPGQHVVGGAEHGRVSAAGSYAVTDGTLVVRGQMHSTAGISMTGAFSVGHASELSWSLPRPTTLQASGYSEIVSRPAYRFSVKPDWSRTAVSDGNPVTIFHWNAPPANTVIRVVEQVRVNVHSSLTPFRSHAAYPLATFPTSVRPYTRITRYLRLSRADQALARQLASGRRSEQEVVEATANWVASHLRYGDSGSAPVTARWVLQHPTTTCRGYANAMAAILRYEGIPSQTIYGWLSSVPINLRGADGSSSRIQWAASSSQGDTHAWLQIYFPDIGWVPFDPQHEKFFIDPRHFAFATYRDAPDPNLGRWTASAPDGQSATGPSLANGSFEIAPIDGVGSQVSVNIHDTFHATMDGIRHDVKGVLLLSR